MAKNKGLKDYLFEEILSEKDESDAEIGLSVDDDEIASHEIDIQIENSTNNECLLPEERADMLYDMAGVEETEVNNTMIVHPSPHMLTTSEEEMILQAKEDLSIAFDLDSFQVQAVVALMNNRNVILTAPCGAGKLLVFHLGVHLMRQKFNLPKGVGICLEPLNNILVEKTNNNPPIKTAYLTMTGEGIKEENASISHSLEEISSGEIGCILGHAESFLSAKGMILFSQYN